MHKVLIRVVSLRFLIVVLSLAHETVKPVFQVPNCNLILLIVTTVPIIVLHFKISRFFSSNVQQQQQGLLEGPIGTEGTEGALGAEGTGLTAEQTGASSVLGDLPSDLNWHTSNTRAHSFSICANSSFVPLILLIGIFFILSQSLRCNKCDILV